MVDRKKEAICAITRQDAMNCLASSANGMYADVACPAGDGKFLTSVQMPRNRFEAVLGEAGDLVCVCDDAALPGYAVAFYDRKFDRWLRVRTNPRKVAETVAKMERRGRKKVS